jgi:large subunit ribosomal protein L23
MEKIILEKVISSEKVVRMIEKENLLCFETDRKVKKEEIKREVEELFDVKVENVKTLTRANKKRAYVKLKPEFVAADVATKIGML